MQTRNTATSFGLIARSFHWLTALVILTAFPLGIIANDMATGPETIAAKAQLFSLHKTLGVAAFFLGLARILWALTQPRPAPLHPDRRLESFAAEAVHWMLYLSLLLVPLSGWVHHAAVDGFAPILWPFGQGLPLVPKSEAVAAAAGGVHWVITKLLVVAILLHIAGALKHHLIDRDDTLRRMTRGTSAPAQALAQTQTKAGHSAIVPLGLALVVYAAGVGAALYMAAPNQGPAIAQTATQTSGNWQVQSGTLGFSVQQMGAGVDGSFANWTAEITHDDTITDGETGQVKVTIDLASVTLGSVSDQAKGPEFFDVATQPSAVFEAKLTATAEGPRAVGTLVLHGLTQPVTLPFALNITGDTAEMTGEVTLDRRDFGIGAGYADEATVGFSVIVKIALTAKKN